MTRYILALMMLMSALAATAADPFKTAKAAIKSGNGLEAAETALTSYAGESGTAPSDRARAYNMAAQVAQKIYSVENEKLYLKKQFDTVRYFNSLLRLYEHTLLCDSIDAQPDERGRVRVAYKKDNRNMRTRGRDNLLQGGKWMMRHRRYAEAYNMFHIYCQGDTDLLAQDTLARRIALWSTKCAFASDNMPGVLQYVDSALALGEEVHNLLEYRATAQLAEGDSTAWEGTLVEGMERCPSDTYFYHTMNRHYRAAKRHRDILPWTERMIASCPDTLAYRYALCQLYYELQQPDECIAACDEAIRRNPDFADAYFYQGDSWLHKAETFAKTVTYDTKSRQYKEQRARLTDMYESVRRPMETYRRMRPSESKTWAPILYKVYYALNLGAELEEVERLIK